MHPICVSLSHSFCFTSPIRSSARTNASRIFSPGSAAGLGVRDGGNARVQASLKAEEILNTWSETEVGRILGNYGDEWRWRHIAKEIVQGRLSGGIHTTSELVDVIRRSSVTRSGKKGRLKHGMHPATQGFRIAMNEELKSLEAALSDAFTCPTPGGRLQVISLHSIEDRMVKQFLPCRRGCCHIYGGGGQLLMRRVNSGSLLSMETEAANWANKNHHDRYWRLKRSSSSRRYTVLLSQKTRGTTRDVGYSGLPLEPLSYVGSQSAPAVERNNRALSPVGVDEEERFLNALVARARTRETSHGNSCTGEDMGEGREDEEKVDEDIEDEATEFQTDITEGDYERIGAKNMDHGEQAGRLYGEGLPSADEEQYRSRHPAAGLARQSLTATDLAKGLLDVQGWKVLRNETGEQVGIVDEIIHIGSANSDEIYESVLKLVQVSPPEAKVGNKSNEEEGSDEEDGLEFLVPLVEDIVKSVDISLRCLFITPPAGLLELARIPEILKRLEPQLLEFCQHQNAGILSCLDSFAAHQSTRFSDDAKQLVAWSGHIQPLSRDVFMPTRRQLLSAGRHDLVEEIMAAGGFLSVAQALGLRSRRRPVGFWEDLRNLDAEIEWFVSGCWVVQQSPETGEEIYYNQATNEYSTQKPPAGNVSDPVPVSQDEDDVGTAVMPRQQQVLDAGRYDLHHAILLHGGYKLVAQELGRQPVSRDTTTKLVAKLREFMEENSFSTFPSFDTLRAFERYDLVCSLRKHGGINSVAQMMDLRPKRYGKGQWYSLDCAAAAIRSYMCNKIISNRGLAGSSMDRCDLEDAVWHEAVKAGTLEIPTQAYALKDGRSDLRYLLQKYGRKDLAEYLGIKYVDRRRKRSRKKKHSDTQRR